ncbi:hypothetical protein VE02_08904 [Pseudogymnoascus sp. 03VT05]|nr:hypothetical protein VE02_08904 [Pseudogymnoascus sp. 03VT05]
MGSPVPIAISSFSRARYVDGKNEAELRLAIEKVGIAGITRMKAFSATFDNPARFPFIVSEIVLDLLQIQSKESTATSYITTLINREIKRAENNKLPGATVSECLEQQILLAEYLIPDLDDAPCILVHGDPTAENVIVDQDLNVKAIIDLGFAEIILLQFSTCFPNFLTHDFESEHEPVEAEYGSETDGPLVWRSRNIMMRRDREFYLQCVEKLSCGGPMLEKYYRLLAAEDEIRRYWWVVAATKLKVHRAMAACNWLRTGPALKPLSF